MQTLLEDMRLWAKTYIAGYEAQAPDEDIRRHIQMKKEHTGYVVEISKSLAAHLGLSGSDLALAELIGLFHDIGRFKQYTVYRTFDDQKSENHAQLGLREIADMEIWRRLSAEDARVFRFAIANHNAMRIAPGVDERAMRFAKIIRDADKLDIYRVLEPTLQPSDSNGFSEDFVEDFLAGRQCDYAKIRTVDDRKLVRLLWMYDIYFGWTMRQMLERGYIAKIVSLLPDTQETRRGAAMVEAHMKEKAAARDAGLYSGAQAGKAPQNTK